MINEQLVKCENLIKIYKKAGIEVVALQGLDLSINQGEIVGIIGSSGSGKSTLLNILGGLDIPSAGTAIVGSNDLSVMNNESMIRYKRDIVGFIWQNTERNLIPYLTAYENIELVMKIRGYYSREAIEYILENVDMLSKKDKRIVELSGGEQQRIAIAVGISTSPKLLLADEPTGSVDSKTASMIMDTFNNLRKNMGISIIVVTHDSKIAAKVDRVLLIRDGRISSEYLRKNQIEQADAIHCDEFGEHTHDEFSVIDKNGRLQIPADIIQKAGLSGQTSVKIIYEDGKICITPVKCND
ncbi:MAG: ATP-binding cassette domain-containing protein [Saccharofermentanales bacterium]